jgi:hypothetical protein
MLRLKEPTSDTVGNSQTVVADSQQVWSSSLECGRGDARTHAVKDYWHVTKCYIQPANWRRVLRNNLRNEYGYKVRN